MTDMTPQAALVRTVADQMAESVVDAAWKRLKEEQAADSSRRMASWPAWLGLGLSVLTSIVIAAMWFGGVEGDIAYARDGADEAKAESKANASAIADMKTLVAETRSDVRWLVKQQEQERGR